MGLKKEELDYYIPLVIKGDNNAFLKLQKEYDALINQFVNTFYMRLNFKTLNLYDKEDLYQELWLFIIRRLPTYNSNIASFMTWLYPNVKGCCLRLLRDTTRGNKKYPIKINEEGIRLINYPASLQQLVSSSQSLAGDKNSELIDFIVEPTYNIEEKIYGKIEIIKYIYILKNIIDSFSDDYKYIYMHEIKGLTQMESSTILNLSQAQVSRIRKKMKILLIKQAERYIDKNINIKEAKEYYDLVLNEKSAEFISKYYFVNYKTLKICRELLKSINIDKDNE